MTKWLLALGILAASAVRAHAAVGVALPLPVFLIVFAIFIVLLVLLLAIGGMSHFGAWWSKRGLPAKALTAGLLVLVLAGFVATWIYRDAVADEWNWVSTMRPYRLDNFDRYVLTAERERALKPLEVFRECAEKCPEMVVIPAGQFMMGSPVAEKGRAPNEGPQHEVTIARPFAVAKFDVTFADWNACAEVGGCEYVDGSHVPMELGVKDFPVDYVSWYDGRTYVAWLSRMTNKTYRLLTEAEWEYAARAGTMTPYYWGESCEWCDALYKPEHIGIHKPNAFTLYNMTDNVEQWVEDCWHPNYEGAPIDGSAWLGGDCNQRVVRGGAGGKDRPRTAHRDHPAPEYKQKNRGFRVARTLEP